MKFSESWLRSFVNPSVHGSDFSHLLTMAGLEVEEEEKVAPDFDKVVIARVLEVAKHPDADRLNVCTVDAGLSSPLQIVCGAPNVTADLRVPCALPGANLPGDFQIKVAIVRGIESSGMLCSAKELGISDDASGLLVLAPDAPIGQNIREYLDLDDRALTLKLTPNRADCLSLLGIAREVAALTDSALTLPTIADVAVSTNVKRDVVLDAPTACPLYCGRVISGVNAKASTPEWMKRRLERSGIRSISALVDITNYVMLELGQPLHAFDNALLEGAIHARLASKGEAICLLNEQVLELQDDVLLISDDKRAGAMAGIMGGANSGISLETKEMFLESAFFSPRAIAGRARRYSFSSDASHRFERGVDFGCTRPALERATQLVLDICGGDAGPITEAKADLPSRAPVKLRLSRLTKVLGIDFSAQEVERHLTRLALDHEIEAGDFIVSPPTHRFDIEIEEDLIEEVVRLYGYDKIPARSPKAQLSMLPQTEACRSVSRVRHMLADRGFQEVVNFAFVEESWEADFASNDTPIKLANPIASQMSVMRSTLIGGLVANVSTNLKRKQNRVRVFETGRCFFRQNPGSPVPGFHQPLKVAGLAYGSTLPEQWGCPSRNVDFYDIKAEVEFLLAPATARFERADHPAFHPGRCAHILLDGETIGVLGEIHPEWVQEYELPVAPVAFEMDLNAILKTHPPTFREVSRQPYAVRDLAILVDQKLDLARLLDGLEINKPAIVHAFQLFDVYTGKGVEPGKKSLAFRIVMQDTQRTLLDVEVDAAIQKLIGYMQQSFAAQLRV